MRKLSVALFLLAYAGDAGAATVVLTFEGLQNLETVNDFYNGGTGSEGSSGANYGVHFSNNSLALTSGDYAGEPTEPTILFFPSGGASTMDVAGGFDTGFSFYYSAINEPGSILVYAGPNATGNILATLELPTTPTGDAACGGANFCPFVPIGVSFFGSAKSVDFGGSADQIGFDDITLGAVTPGGGPSAVPEPSTGFVMGGALAACGIFRRKRRSAGSSCHT